MAFCVECGKELQNDLKYCPYCGAKQLSFMPDTQPTEQDVKADGSIAAVQSENLQNDAVIYMGEPTADEPDSAAQTSDDVTEQTEIIEPECVNPIAEATSVDEAAADSDVPVNEAVTVYEQQQDNGGANSDESLTIVDSADEGEEYAVGATAQPIVTDNGYSSTSEPTVNDTFTPVNEPPIQPLEPTTEQFANDSTFTGAYGAPPQNNEYTVNNVSEAKKQFTFFCVKDGAECFDRSDISENRIISAISYLPPLFFLPLVLKKDSKFARFHANQSLLLTITAAVWSILNIILSVIIKANFHTATFWGYTQLNAAGVILTTIVWSIEIIGIVTLFYLGLIDTMNGRAKKLPIIGGFNFLFK